MLDNPIVKLDRLAAGCRLPHLDDLSPSAADAHDLDDEIDGAPHVASEIDEAIAGEVAVELHRLLEREPRAVGVDGAHEPAVPGVEQAKGRKRVGDRELAGDD